MERTALPATTVEFSLRVPVDSLTNEQSDSLDQLVAVWRSTSGVEHVNVEWTAMPSESSPIPRHAIVDARIQIAAADAKGLRLLYNKLTKEANKEPGRLSRRGCVLTDLY